MSEPKRESPTDASNRRAYFRVDYPAHDRPVFTAGALRGETAQVEGVVARCDARTLVLRLDVAKLPFGEIIKEQLWRRSQHPWRGGK